MGISAKSMEEKDGISIIRVASNSPLSKYVQMGETITKVNNIPVKNPDDLKRIIMTSTSRIILRVEGENQVCREVEVVI